MKRIIILISILCFFSKAFTQEYTPMLEIGKIWNMHLSFDYPDGYYFNLKVTETVEINGLTYYRLEASHNNCEIYLREDINEKKIYGIWEGEEYLHYDFSLDVGDNIWIDGNFYEITLIEYDDFYGMENLRYLVLDNSFKLIEGVGIENSGIADAFEYGCLNNPINETIELIGMNQQLALNDIITFNNIILLPNPVKDVLYIENYENIIIKKIIVYDILGKVILKENNSFNQLNLTELNSGILFIKIETKEGIITKKIIKE